MSAYGRITASKFRQLLNGIADRQPMLVHLPSEPGPKEYWWVAFDWEGVQHEVRFRVVLDNVNSAFDLMFTSTDSRDAFALALAAYHEGLTEEQLAAAAKPYVRRIRRPSAVSESRAAAITFVQESRKK